MKEMMQYYKVIGQVNSAISKAENLEDALKEGLRIILDNSSADYAVIWYLNKETNTLHPYYWICPVDFTSKHYGAEEGIAGQVFNTQKPVRKLDYKAEPDDFTDKDFGDVSPVSMVCVPISTAYENLGCIQFVSKSDTELMTEEDADLCEMLTMMAGLAIGENSKLLVPWEDRDVIMSVRNITREFKNGEHTTKVLKGVNLDIYEGEFLVLLGESGCGKSTLLNILGGMDSATSGEFKFRDTDLSHANQEELTKYRRDNIGFIFQSYNLMPNLNAKQNLDLIGELVDDPMDSLEALKLVGLDQKFRSYPSMLSGGQQQRISIARALVKKPKIIMADEPTAALDYTTSIEVLSVLEEVLKQGTTLVMVTHNEEITKMADRVVRMRDGKMYEVTVNTHRVKATDLVW